MTKHQWTKRQIEAATKEDPPTNPKYINAFLKAVQEGGESLTRTRFFELFEMCRPPDDVDADYFDYEVLDDHFALLANFREAWDIPEAQPLPKVTTVPTYGQLSLPADFCTLGGTPDWIQNEKYPICSECDGDMVLFLQLKSLPYELTKANKELRAFTFGDAGNFYVFHCTNCGTVKNSSECY